MATNLQIDDKLIRKAVKLGKHRTKKGRRHPSADRLHPTY